MPQNTVIVDRRSVFGNPFRFQNDLLYSDASHRRHVLSKWVLYDNTCRPVAREMQNIVLVQMYQAWIQNVLEYPDNVIRCNFTYYDIKDQLAGKNLACWCAMHKACHSDVLLEIANS